MSGNVPFRRLPISFIKGPALDEVSLAHVLEAVDNYTAKAINHIPDEIHDAKHQTAHHRG